MKARTRKLAWLLSAAMVFTSVNPGMTAMASEETEVTEQSVEESSEADGDAAAEDETSEAEDVEILEEEGFEEEGSIEESATEEPEEGEEQLLVADEEGTEAVVTYADKSWSIEGEKEQTVTGYLGKPLSISVKVNNSGNEELAYRWRVSDYLGEDDGYGDDDDVEEAVENTVTLESLYGSQRYACTVSDTKGNSELVIIYVNCIDTIQVPDYEAYVSVKIGDDMKFTANATSTVANATLTYEWTKGNDTTVIGKEQTYVKKNFSETDTGYWYRCKITDGYSVKTVGFQPIVDSGLRVQVPERFELENGETKILPISVTTDREQSTIKVIVNKYDPTDTGWTELQGVDWTKFSITGTDEMQVYWLDVNDDKTEKWIYITVGPRALLDGTSETKEKAKELNPGIAETAVIYGDAEQAYFKFVPKKAGTWRFYSKGIYGTSGEIYDKNGKHVVSDAKDEEGQNFNIEAELKANEVYYLETEFAGIWYNAYGSFKVNAELVSEKNCQHQWGEATVTKKATCAEEGVSVKRCSVCGEEVSSIIPKTAHSFGAYQVTTAPTALATGVQTRTCSVCGYKETSEIAKLPASVSLSATSVPLQVKQSVSLEKLITAMTTGDRLVSCSSSNKKIATVSNSGKVTGKAAGNAKITMTFASGITKTVTVKVQKKKVTTSKITNVPGSITLKVKKTYKLSPVIAPISTKEKATYKTANKKIATVSKSGKITAKKAGKTTITVKVGKKTKKVKVTVKK